MALKCSIAWMIQTKINRYKKKKEVFARACGAWPECAKLFLCFVFPIVQNLHLKRRYYTQSSLELC